MSSELFNQIKTYRDVSLIKLRDRTLLVIACDSAGGIGEKEMDAVKVSPYILGRFTSRVSLMEIISINAHPISLSITICAEPHPTGDLILNGIKDELKEIGLQDISFTISTEKNIKTVQTGLGVTCIGLCKNDNLLLGKVQKGDKIYIAGIPKIGKEVNLNDPEIFDLKTLLKLKELKNVKEIIPVGSKGVLGELENFSICNSLKYKLFNPLPIDIKKSAGPSTCAIIFSTDTLKSEFRVPLYLIGEIE
ncbi:alpha-ribazole kinase [Thermovenabulum sp.]|uniref:alpha-ribazole kinase n=1 Tax=Thermovenabulum sp. TaxID=3100335 RepID=UPI003C7E4369